MLSSAALQGQPYHFVILDMKMPETDGMEIARRIRSNNALPDVRLLMLTSAGRPDVPVDANRLGICAFLTKPVRRSKLYNCMLDSLRSSAPTGPLYPATENDCVNQRDDFDADILVAEDNLVNQEVVKAMLDALGCRYDVTANGMEAIQAVSGKAYDLILMDCQMPVIDGYEATRVIRGKGPFQEAHPQACNIANHRLPIIAMTAHAMEGDREQCLINGMDDYLSKPFNLIQLRSMLERWLPRDSTSPMATLPPSRQSIAEISRSKVARRK